jgi:hypothetical protein
MGSLNFLIDLCLSCSAFRSIELHDGFQSEGFGCLMLLTRSHFFQNCKIDSSSGQVEKLVS